MSCKYAGDQPQAVYIRTCTAFGEEAKRYRNIIIIIIEDNVAGSSHCVQWMRNLIYSNAIRVLLCVLLQYVISSALAKTHRLVSGSVLGCGRA